jgi:hypothetical protein
VGDGEERAKNQGLGLSLGWKTRAHLGFFQWQRLLVCLAIRKARKGEQPFYTEGNEGSRVWKGGGVTFRKEWHTGFYGLLPSHAAGLAQLEASLARRQVGLVGRERMDSKRERRKKGQQKRRKERLNLASIRLNVLSKLCYMITLITQQYETICRAMP